MAYIDLTQPEADALIAMEKHRVDDTTHRFPPLGGTLTVPLHSADRREEFLLDIGQGRIDLLKTKLQNRARQVVILVRLDLAGAPHRNPDGEEVPCPHLHRYREGFGDKWASPVPAHLFRINAGLWETLEDFMHFCNITEPPYIQRGLFAC